MSVTVLRAVSGSAAPKAVSALITSVQPPSIFQPPSLLVAAVVLLLFASPSVPGASFTIVADPAMDDAIVAVPPASVVMFAGVGPSVSVDAVMLYPFVLSASELADSGAL